MKKKSKNLEIMIEEALLHYLDRSVMVDKDKLDAIKTAIAWVNTKNKLAEDEFGAFFEDEEKDEKEEF